MADDQTNPLGLDMRLLPWRQIIFDVAAGTPGVGAIAESLKWGEPSYTPAKKSVGSSVRLAVRKDEDVAMNFICHTGLIDRFRELYSGQLEFEGNRTIILDAKTAEAPLRHCIAMALTYHLRNKT